MSQRGSGRGWYVSEDVFVGILTSADATCLAMVNIRLSVISHGGSTFSWSEKVTERH